MGAGVSFQPVPWWQTGDTSKYTRDPQAALANLEASAPAGYEYDPVQMGYSRTPTSAGSRAAQFTEAALGGIPSLAGLSGGAPSSGAFGTSTTSAGAASGGGTNVGSTSVGGLSGVGPISSGSSSSGSGPVSSGSRIAPVQMPDQAASNSAIFAAAKDKVGKLSRASLDSLNSEMGAQGMLGSGAQVQGTRDLIASGAGELGQVARDTAVSNANLASDFAKTGYQGEIAQRGQDVQSQEANARLALEQREAEAQLGVQRSQLGLQGEQLGLQRQTQGSQLGIEQAQLGLQRQAQQYSLLNMILGGLKGGAGSSLY